MTNRPEAAPRTDQDADPGWQVYCLCAAWCGVCDEWRGEFQALAAAHPGLRFAWIDIEDEAEALGEVEVETFPTLLVAQGGASRFFGPVPPQPGVVTRLLASLQAQPAPAVEDVAGRELLARLQGSR